MYCNNCKSEIPDDSLFCPRCGMKQERSITPVSNTKEEFQTEKIETVKLPCHADINDDNYHQKDIQIQLHNISFGAYIGRRIIGTIIDKLAILFICIIATYSIGSVDYEFFGDLGTFSAMFHMSAERVHSMASGHVILQYPDDYILQHQSEIDDYFMYLLGIELKITSLFVLINILYYVLGELLVGSSIGKFYWGLRLISNHDASAKKITPFKVFYRAFCFVVVVSGVIGLRWLVGFNYYVAILLFFLVMDFPVFFRRQSLIDIMSRSKLIYEKNLV